MGVSGERVEKLHGERSGRGKQPYDPDLKAFLALGLVS